jgi:hypothetical protein
MASSNGCSIFCHTVDALFDNLRRVGYHQSPGRGHDISLAWLESFGPGISFEGRWDAVGLLLVHPRGEADLELEAEVAELAKECFPDSICINNLRKHLGKSHDEFLETKKLPDTLGGL